MAERIRLRSAPGALRAAPPTLNWSPDGEGSKGHDRRRRQSQPWRKWYNLRRWKVLRVNIFKRDGFVCAMCGRAEGRSSQLVCDHVRPHRGDAGLFWDETNLQTLCKPCHDSDKQRMERSAGD